MFSHYFLVASLTENQTATVVFLFTHGLSLSPSLTHSLSFYPSFSVCMLMESSIHVDFLLS